MKVIHNFNVLLCREQGNVGQTLSIIDAAALQLRICSYKHVQTHSVCHLVSDKQTTFLFYHSGMSMLAFKITVRQSCNSMRPIGNNSLLRKRSMRKFTICTWQFASGKIAKLEYVSLFNHEWEIYSTQALRATQWCNSEEFPDSSPKVYKKHCSNLFYS